MSGPAPGAAAAPASAPRRSARARASGITRWPPATSVSLLAVATILPASRAASTERSATRPPVATSTRSTSGRAAISCSASRPEARATPEGRSSRAAAACVCKRHDLRPESAGLLLEKPRLGAGGQGHDPEAVGHLLEHLDRLAADRAPRAEQRDAHDRRAAGNRGAGHRGARHAGVVRVIRSCGPKRRQLPSATRPRPGSANERGDIERGDGAREDERVHAVKYPAVTRESARRSPSRPPRASASTRPDRRPAPRARSAAP